MRDIGFAGRVPPLSDEPSPQSMIRISGGTFRMGSDKHNPEAAPSAAKPCYIPHNPRGGREQESYDPSLPETKTPRKVLKGGSHLCAPNYCRRYRSAARQAEAVDTSTSTLVFDAL